MFQATNPETQKQNECKVAGLTRGLYPQPGKAEEAVDLLNQLPASIQTGSLLTNSGILQAMKRYVKAEELLKQIVKKEAGDPVTAEPCRNHGTNIALTCLCQMMGKLNKAQSQLQQCLSDNTLVDIQKDRFMLTLSILHCGTNEFDTYIGDVINCVDKTLSQSIHKLRIYCERVVENGSEESILLDQACNYVKEAM